MTRTTVDTRIAAVLQIFVGVLCAVVGWMSLARDFEFAGTDLTAAGHRVGVAFLAAASVLLVLAGANLLSRVVVDADGTTVTSLGRSRALGWDDLAGIDFGTAPGRFGTTVVLRTTSGARVGTGVLRLRHRANVFAFARAVEEAGHETLLGERIRRYLESNGLHA